MLFSHDIIIILRLLLLLLLLFLIYITILIPFLFAFFWIKLVPFTKKVFYQDKGGIRLIVLIGKAIARAIRKEFFVE